MNKLKEVYTLQRLIDHIRSVKYDEIKINALIVEINSIIENLVIDIKSDFLSGSYSEGYNQAGKIINRIEKLQPEKPPSGMMSGGTQKC